MAKLSRDKISAALAVLWSYMRRYKAALVILSILSILSALGNAIVPYIAGQLFDAILEPETVFAGTAFAIALPWFLLIVWGLVQAVTSVTDWRISVSSMKLGSRVFFDYISRGFGHLLVLPLSFHSNRRTGEVTSKIQMTAGKLESMFSNILIQLAPQFLSLFVAIGITFYINWVIGLVFLLGVCIYVGILGVLVRPLAKLQRKLHKTFSRSFGDAHDTVYNYKQIKESVTETREHKRLYNRFSGPAHRIEVKLRSVFANLTFSQRVIILATQISVFALSIVFVTNGTMTIGEVFVLNSYSAIIFGPFVQLGNQWQQIQNGVIDLYETEKILQMSPEKYRPKNEVALDGIAGAVEFRNVSFWYEKKKPIVTGISFRVEPGQTVALVGESGVGKSTLMDLISGYHFPRKGRVLIDNVNIRNINLTFLRSHIAVVSQEVVLFNDTIKNNIKYGSFNASDAQVEEAARQANLLDDIEQFPKKWRQIVGERGIKLSVGQKQRVAIARAILRDPTLLILDEPTSALDAKTEHYIQQSLETLMEGRTTFIIAHRLSTVRHADQILVLKDGQIIERGTHQELIQQEGGEYKRLHDLQIGLHE